MTKFARRVLFALATSTGIIAASTLSAHAGQHLNHCEPCYPR
jgi:hypothetical protein